MEDIFITSKRDEAAYNRRKYYNKAQYSLDRDDGIERHILKSEPSAEEVYNQEATAKQFSDAISTLPDKQARRIYAYYFSGMSKVAIAHSEGVAKQVIDVSIRNGLKSIRKYMENFL